MTTYANCIIQPSTLPTWEARDTSRCVTPLITRETCGSDRMVTGLWRLYPGHESDPDLHPDADEIYYVVAGEGRLVLGDESYTVRAGMTVFIPANVRHQSFNAGPEDLVYYFIFAPAPAGPSMQEAQGWVKKE
ncbi:MAG: cupin domain-containing protein [candidate division Zixibacteria bacterium]|nr:cupin domain-containing protein [candidate division Zixibacteria bacterium]